MNGGEAVQYLQPPFVSDLPARTRPTLAPPFTPGGGGEEALHGPGRDTHRLGEILGVAPVLGLYQEGPKIVLANDSRQNKHKSYRQNRLRGGQKCAQIIKGSHVLQVVMDDEG